MEPSFKLSKSIDWSGISDGKDTERVKRPPYDIEVMIGLSDWVYGELTKRGAYPNDLVNLLLPATQALNKALELWDFAGSADEWNDRSYWNLVSISPHPQNNRYRSWVILIELCRDLWKAAWDNNRVLAKSVLNLWRSLKYPVFRRLTLHAMTVTDVSSQDNVVNYLLEDNGWWLWSVETRREVFRLLAVLWPELDEETADHLIDTILQGPPKEMFRVDLTHGDWEQLFDHDIWLMLSKLQSFGRALPTKAKEILQQLTLKHPDWALQKGERDEFTHWSETRVGHEVDITADELFAKEVPELIDYLSQDSMQYGEGRIDLFRVGCKSYRKKVIEVLHYLTSSGNWHKHIWHAGLVGLAVCDEKTWGEVAPLLVEASPEFYREEAWAIAWWTKKTASSIDCESPEEVYFWSVFESILDNVLDDEEPDRDSDAVNYAINHPVGIITEALMDRFSAYKLEVGQGIPDGPLQACVNQLISSKTQSSLAGKIIFASRLHYFHAVDPGWAEGNLIPLFDWKDSEFAAWIWQGYLWSPRISTDLVIVLKEHLVSSVKRADQLGDSADRLFQLFTIVCLEYPNLYKAQEKHDVLIAMGPDGLVHVAKFFWHSISGDADSADNYWRNRIKPFMRRAWPKAAEFVSDKTSEYLALMATELDEAFGEVLGFIIPLLKPWTDLSSLLTHLDNKSLPDQQPRQVMRLLSAVFTYEDQWPPDIFRNILNRLVKAEQEIANDSAYRVMDDYLVQRDL
jgi:hypothetical protein